LITLGSIASSDPTVVEHTIAAVRPPDTQSELICDFRIELFLPTRRIFIMGQLAATDFVRNMSAKAAWSCAGSA
jgi:hypothetical protein